MPWKMQKYIGQCSLNVMKNIEYFQIVVGGEKILFAAEMGDFGGRLVAGHCNQERGPCFEVIFDNSTSEFIQYFFEDEKTSLLSDNLWEIGW